MDTVVSLNHRAVLDGCSSGEVLSHQQEEDIINLAFDILSKRYAPGEKLSDPIEVSRFLQLRLKDCTREVFGCIYLSTQHQVIACEDLFFGTIDGAPVYPRTVVEQCFIHNAGAVIAYHNHTHVVEPSE